MSIVILGKVLPSEICCHVAKFLTRSGISTFHDPQSIWLKELVMAFLYHEHGNPCFRLDPDPLLETLRFHSFYANACTPFWLDDDEHILMEANKRSLVRYSKNRRYVCDVDVFQWRPRAAHVLPMYQAMLLKKRILS